jgi:hypothetical protein
VVSIKPHPPAVPIGQEAGWAPEPVWTLWRGEKCLASAENRTPAIQPVAMPTELSPLPVTSTKQTECTDFIHENHETFVSLVIIGNKKEKREKARKVII